MMLCESGTPLHRQNPVQKHLIGLRKLVFLNEGSLTKAIRKSFLDRTAVMLGADIMAQDHLKQYLVPLCAGLMHPKVWKFCKDSPMGQLRWADTRQRAYYLLKRFTTLMYTMQGCGKVAHLTPNHLNDPMNPATAPSLLGLSQ